MQWNEIEPVQVRERLVEDGRGHVLGVGAITHPPRDERVDLVDVRLVQHAELARVTLRVGDVLCLDVAPLAPTVR